jgi:hypothetical protein
MKNELRNVMLGDSGYRLQVWDTGKTKEDFFTRCYLSYAFFAPGSDEPLFEGDEFNPSPMTGIDSDDSLRCLISFLVLRPGDMDSEYFEKYTPEQMKFAESSNCEWLQMFGMEEDYFAGEEDYEGEHPYPLVDIE